jgi:hypothetical protein
MSPAAATPSERGFPSDLADRGGVARHGEPATWMCVSRRTANRAEPATWMSELHSESLPENAGKPVESHAMTAMARRVHLFAAVMRIAVPTALLTGCPPPPLSLDEPDAAPNATPAVLSVRSETGVELDGGIATNTIVNGVSTMTLTLADNDVDDTLYVRGFFDYNPTISNPPSPRANCSVGPSDPRSVERTVTCSLGALCDASAVGDGLPHVFDILVCDRPPDDAGMQTPRFNSCMPPAFAVPRTYRVICEEAPE